MEKKILTVFDIAKFLHIKPNTIHNRKWQRRTGCPLVKKGKRLLSEEDVFMNWFKKGYIS